MDKAQFKRRGKWVLSAAFLVAIVWIVFDRGSQLNWDEIATSLRAYRWTTVSLAFALAMLAYVCCSSYDLMSRHYVQHDIPVSTVLAIAFVSYAINLNVGAVLGGMGSRYHLYSRYGLSTAKTTQVIGLSVLTNWTGFFLIAGLVMVIEPPHLKASWHVGRLAFLGLGVLLLVLVLAYLVCCTLFHGRRWQFRAVEFVCPSLLFAGLQLGLSSLAWLAASASVLVLMPGHLSFPEVMVAFMASGLGGLIVRLPAGLGVLEGTFVALLGGSVGHSALVAALLAFRAVYYIAPLIAALLLQLALELRAKRRHRPAAGSVSVPASEALRDRDLLASRGK